MNNRYKVYVVLLSLFAIIGIFIKVGTYDFLSLDDISYIIENPHVTSGLTYESIRFVFLNSWAANWHPLTYISLMTDVSLFGVNPSSHHLVNLFFHILNMLLLLLVLEKLTGSFWKSLSVALLFSFHPMHVESVAWISERKDVLSTFFFLLTIFFYSKRAEKNNIKNNILVLFCLTMGLLSKPMVVTLPFVLILIDFWPLNRVRSKQDILIIFKEKSLYFILIAISAIITYKVQHSYGAMPHDQVIPLPYRIENALQAYFKYIVKLFYPVNLSIIYPLEDKLNVSLTIFSLCILTGITLFFIRLLKKYPYLIFGWLWYLGTLVPVIGIVQVGSQSMADRYTYIPFIGLFIILSWGIPDLLKKINMKPAVSFVVLGGYIFACAMITNRHIDHFKNSKQLFLHAVSVKEDNYAAHYNLAAAYLNEGNVDKAIEHALIAVSIWKALPTAYYILGRSYLEKADYKKAIANLKEAVYLKPQHISAMYYLATAYARHGEFKNSLNAFQEVWKRKPTFYDALSSYPAKLVKNGQLVTAVVFLRNQYLLEVALDEEDRIESPENPEGEKLLKKGIELIRIKHLSEANVILNQVLDTGYRPTSLYNNFAVVNLLQNRWQDAYKYLNKVLETAPQNSCALANYGVMLFYAGDNKNALSTMEKAIQSEKKAEFYNNLGIVYTNMENIDAALSAHMTSFDINPDLPRTPYCIASLYALKKNAEQAIHWLKKAESISFSDWRLLENDIFFTGIKDQPEFLMLAKRIKKE